MEKLFPNVTPSRVADLVCAKKYYDLHVQRLGPPGSFAYGSGMHSAAKRLFDPTVPTPPAERDLDAAVLRAFAEQPYPDAESKQKDIDRATASLRAYLAAEDQDIETLAVETFGEFSVRADNGRPLKFGAKYDRLIVRDSSPEELVMRDLKTSLVRRVNLEGVCVSLAVLKANLTHYSELFGMRFKHVQAEFDFLDDHGIADRISLGVEDVKSMWSEIMERARHIYGSSEFPAQPGEHCLRCPFLSSCQPSTVLSANDLENIFV